MAGQGVLLDTCALISLIQGRLRPSAMQAVVAAVMQGALFVSPVSAWEIGMLSLPKGTRPALRFLPDPAAWFANVMARPGVRPATLTAGIGIAESYLPGTLHNDPADRLLVATARSLDVSLLTSDGKILAYAAQGHVGAVGC